MKALLVVLWVIASTPARADDPEPAWVRTPLPREPGTAGFLSFVPTVVGVGLVTIGHPSELRNVAGTTLFLAGPTLGHLYAGDPMSGGLLVRLVSGSVFYTAYSLAPAGCFSCNEIPDYIWVPALITYVAATVYEIGTAPAAARRYNRAHAFDAFPAATPIGTGGAAVALVGHF